MINIAKCEGSFWRVNFWPSFPRALGSSDLIGFQNMNVKLMKFIVMDWRKLENIDI